METVVEAFSENGTLERRDAEMPSAVSIYESRVSSISGAHDYLSRLVCVQLSLTASKLSFRVAFYPISNAAHFLLPQHQCKVAMTS